jgi:hypothetical protein
VIAMLRSPLCPLALLVALAACHPPLYAEVEEKRICFEQEQEFDVVEALDVAIPPGVVIPDLSGLPIPPQVQVPPVPFREDFDEDLEIEDEIVADIAQLRIDEFTLKATLPEHAPAGAVRPPLGTLHAVDVKLVPFDPALPEVQVLSYRKAEEDPQQITMRGSGTIDFRELARRGGARLRGTIEGQLPPTVGFQYVVTTRACLYLRARVDPLDNL